MSRVPSSKVGWNMLIFAGTFAVVAGLYGGIQTVDGVIVYVTAGVGAVIVILESRS